MDKISPEVIAGIHSLASQGYTPTEISERLPICRQTATRHVDFPIKGPRSRIRTHREVVQSMTPVEAVDYLLDVIEVLQEDPDRDRLVAIVRSGFTTQEATLLDYLAQREGKACHREKLHLALSTGKSVDEMAEAKLVDVVLCKVRKKLPAGAIIRTIWGHGYEFARQPGAVMPWEMGQ